MRRSLLFGSVFAFGLAVGLVCRERPISASTEPQSRGVENDVAWVSVPMDGERRLVRLKVRRAVLPGGTAAGSTPELGPDDWAVSVGGGTYWLTP